MPEYFELPSEWPSESIEAWIPLLLAAIDYTLADSAAWDESDAEEALQKVDELRVIIAEMEDS